MTHWWSQEKIEQIKNISSNITTQEKIIQINLLATSFTKIKENAIKLLYYSRKNILELENNIQKEKQNYEKLEYIFSYFIMFLIIFLSYLLIKQIIKKSKELESITKKAQLSEQKR